jgi:hypothetical protein
MRHARRPPHPLQILVLATSVVQTACGYGFGNHEFRDERAVAMTTTSPAKALQTGAMM